MFYDSTNVYAPRRPCFNADSIPAKALIGNTLVKIADLARELVDKYNSVLEFSDSIHAKTACLGREVYSEEAYVELFKSILFTSCQRKRKNQAAHIAAVRELIVIHNEEWIPEFDKMFG